MNSRHKAHEYAVALAEASLTIGAIRLSPEKPFLWASGYHMPIYNDNRMLLSSWESRNLVASAFRLMLEEEDGFDIIAGTATAGIPHATTLADLLRLPLVYVRSSSKGHGMGNRIEGIASPDDLAAKRLVLVEDLISTGGSSIAALNALRECGAEVPLCLAIFSYGLDKAADAFSTLDPACRCHPILDYNTLIDVARRRGDIDSEEEKQLRSWRSDPFGWGEKNGFPPKKGE